MAVKAVPVFQRGVSLKCSLHFTMLFFLACANSDSTGSLKPSFVKAGTITLSHSVVPRGKPAGVGLLAAAPKC